MESVECGSSVMVVESREVDGVGDMGEAGVQPRESFGELVPCDTSWEDGDAHTFEGKVFDEFVGAAGQGTPRECVEFPKLL